MSTVVSSRRHNKQHGSDPTDTDETSKTKKCAQQKQAHSHATCLSPQHCYCCYCCCCRLFGCLCCSFLAAANLGPCIATTA